MVVGCWRKGSNALLSPTCPITSLPPFLGCPAGLASAAGFAASAGLVASVGFAALLSPGFAAAATGWGAAGAVVAAGACCAGLAASAGFDSAGLAGAGGAPGEQAASSDVATPPSASWITARREIGRYPDDPMTPLRSPACPTHPGRGDLAAPHLAASHNAVCCAGRPPRRSRRFGERSFQVVLIRRGSSASRRASER